MSYLNDDEEEGIVYEPRYFEKREEKIVSPILLCIMFGVLIICYLLLMGVTFR